MTWDKTAYNNVDRITLHGWYLWKPDIVLYNTYGTMYSVNSMQSQINHTLLVLFLN